MSNIGKLRNMTAIYLLCDDKILLLFRQGSRVVNNLWIASAGGHFEESELNDAQACILRELREELNITPDMLENFSLRYVTLRRTKGEIRQNYYFFAELKNGTSLQLTSEEGILQWFLLDEVSNLAMPFSARFVIEHYRKTGKHTEHMYGGVADGEKVVFTKLPEF